MKKFISLLAAAFITLMSTAALTTPANASGFIWRNYDADPAFKTRDAAMAYRETYFRDRAGWTGKVLAAAMEATSHPGTVVQHGLKPGMHLETMMAGGNQLYHDVEVAASPSFGNGVDVEVWTFKVDGTIYSIYLPVMCHNWSEQVSSANVEEVVVEPVKCQVISAQLAETSDLHVGVLGNDPIVDKFHCLAYQLPGESVWHKFQNNCEDNCHFTATSNALHKELLQSTHFTSGAGVAHVRVPLEFQFEQSTHVTTFCKTSSSGQSCGTVVVPLNFHRNDAIIWNSPESIPVDRRSYARLIWVMPVMRADGSPICEAPSESDYKRIFAQNK